MKIQLYPIQDNSIQDSSIQETQIDPLIKLLDEFFKKPIDTDKDKCYNNYIK